MALFAVSVNTVRSYSFVICCFKPILIIFIKVNIVLEPGDNGKKIFKCVDFWRPFSRKSVLSEQFLLYNLYLYVAHLLHL